MKLKCGPNQEELDFIALTREGKLNHLRKWHRFFAILPREVAPGECRWLEWIERRCPNAKYNIFGEIDLDKDDLLYNGTVEYRAIKK